MINADVKVSVIIPIFNAADYLRPALDSVISQTLREIEIICVDDGSTDNSLEILKEYQQNDDRIRIVTETNAGPALARNNGIKRARGEYIAFLDDDDFYEPRFLEMLYERSKEHDLDIAISDYDIFNMRKSCFQKAASEDHEEVFEEGRVTSKNEYPDHIFSSTNGSAWNKLFRRSFIVDKELRFLPDVKMYEDVYFVVTALSLAEKIEKIPTVLMHHRIYDNQTRVKMFCKYYSQVPVIYVKIKEFLMHSGMYSPLFSSYLNMTATRCFKIYHVLGSDAKASFWNMLHGEYSKLMDWHGKSLSDFESPEICEFVANVEMFDHDLYKKRLSRGLTLRLENLKNSAGGRRRGIVRFFARVFSKREKD